ncbi:DUF6680 family protein, partial [Xanthomonas oryzae]|uniref:DUF6680 family protein n=1 Tax=Xanthomonas oryzae TaxID=347 RepID=UPI00192C15D7
RGVFQGRLNTLIDNEPVQQWVSRGHELFVNVLYAIAVEVGLTFDRVQLKKGVYSSSAHGRVEDEQERVRQLAISVLSGEQPLTMKIESMPSDQEAREGFLKIQSAISNALNGDAVNVVIVKKDNESPLKNPQT